jgi:peroxin-19
LEENASKISAEEKVRYESQLNLMKEVCDELEKEKADDSANVKKERFNKVLESMQQMQALGSLPEEILGEGGNNPDLPNFANLTGDGTMNNEQCSIM